MSVRIGFKDNMGRGQPKDYVNTLEKIKVGQGKGITTEMQAIK